MSSGIIIEERTFGAIARGIFVAFAIPSLIILSYILLILSDNYPGMVVNSSVTNTIKTQYKDTSLSEALVKVPSVYTETIVLINSYINTFKNATGILPDIPDTIPDIQKNMLRQIAGKLNPSSVSDDDLKDIHNRIKNNTDKKYIDLFTNYYFKTITIDSNTLKSYYDSADSTKQTNITKYMTGDNTVPLDVFKTETVSQPQVGPVNSDARCIANENTMKTVEKSLIVILFLQSCILGLIVIPFVIHSFRSLFLDKSIGYFLDNLSNHGVFHKSNDGSSSLWWNGSFLFAFLSSIVIIGFCASLFRKFKNRQTYYTYSSIPDKPSSAETNTLQNVKDKLEINKPLQCVQFSSNSDLKNHWNGALTCIVFVSIQLFLFTGIVTREERNLKNVVTEVKEISELTDAIKKLTKAERQELIQKSKQKEKDAANTVKKGADTANTVNEGADAANTVNKGADAANTVNEGADAANTVNAIEVLQNDT